MMETKTLHAEFKTVSGSGEFEAILSMPTLDRDGEIIDAKAFEPLPARITIDLDHGMSAKTTVGSGVPYYEGDVLKIKGTFASTHLGQEARTLAVEGHLPFMSVAYMNSKYVTADDGVPHLVKAELLNAAMTPIPSNREAAILVAKSHDGEPSALWVNIVKAVRAIDAAAAELKSLDTVETKSADTDPDLSTPAPVAAVDAPAAVDVARGLAALALAQAEIALS